MRLTKERRKRRWKKLRREQRLRSRRIREWKIKIRIIRLKKRIKIRRRLLLTL
jgi:hypothetical protein